MLKRAFDIISSLIVLVLISPLMIPIMILLRLTGEGKVFYIQQRVGKSGKNFGLFKFATMLENSPNLAGGDVTAGSDPRVLPVGRVLRKTKINEIPQLLNIFLGDISVVGPRPLTPRTFGFYPESIQVQIRDLKPGLTGIGSIVFRDEESVLANSPKPHLQCYQEDIAPYKGELEVWYKKNYSFKLDILLIFLTAWAIFFPKSNLHLKLFKDLPKSKTLSLSA
ncbi:sugar transferase [Echinicola rosea]|uniref:UDP-phosphate galactose phosphotransferase n=1 Tax=Echinicola rosea TaxID=1807691 RepID=A0ABQ1VCG7_9BACT|nr:sugar transferase [Echinicola rosea]GGF51668.1 UDP-phosphate galactose phosphotransferase [Echinicola rosea]